MKRYAVVCMLATLILSRSVALAQPAVIPRIGQAPHSATETFQKLKRYFSDQLASQFHVVSIDDRHRTIVAKRSDLDTGTWTSWAYCKMTPTHLLDSLKDGSVTVKVKVEASGRHASYVHIDADFEGTYGGLGSGLTTQQCVSKGVVEQHILTAADASQPG